MTAHTTATATSFGVLLQSNAVEGIQAVLSDPINIVLILVSNVILLAAFAIFGYLTLGAVLNEILPNGFNRR